LTPPLSRPGARQFGKYAIVGVCSLAVGFAIFNAFYYTTHLLLFSATMSYVLSVLNGFVLNRNWTFRDRRSHSVWIQLTRFLGVNIVGYVLNVTVLTLTLAAYTRLTSPESLNSLLWIARDVILHGHSDYPFLVVNGCGIIATAVVTIWNFFANRSWSFKA
jgi:putative flippase GtrA